MMTTRNLGISATLIFFSALVWNVQAQTPPIEIATDNDRVQFSIEGRTHTMHVEVFSRSGELVFEQVSAAGQSIQWQMVDEKGERVIDGVYLATIEVIDPSGKRRKRIEEVVVKTIAQSDERLNSNASITPAASDPINSYASMQPVNFSNGVSQIRAVWNRGLRAPISATAVSITPQYNIGVPRALSVLAVNNTFYPAGNGRNTTGNENSFFGTAAGENNAAGSSNSYFGAFAGRNNLSGTENSFFGSGAGSANLGSYNSFFGSGAGSNNTDGTGNSFFGRYAGIDNENGGDNSFFGFSAGSGNRAGNGNSFFGVAAGQSNGNGSGNSFFGNRAGASHRNGSSNSYFGSEAGESSGGSSNAFFGSRSGASAGSGSSNSYFGSETGESAGGSSNSFFGSRAGRRSSGSSNAFFGSAAGERHSSGNNNAFFGFQAGRDNVFGSDNSIFGSEAGLVSSFGNENSFFGRSAGRDGRGDRNSFFGMNAGQTSSGSSNSFFGMNAGIGNTSGSRNTFVGSDSGDNNDWGRGNTFVGHNTRGGPGRHNATAIGANASVTQNNSLVLGGINGVNNSTADTNVGIGTTAPLSNLHVAFGYVQIPIVTRVPPASDCTVATAGRMVIYDNKAARALLLICDSDTSGAVGQQPGWVVK